MSSIERSFKFATHKVIKQLARISKDTMFNELVPEIRVLGEENIEKAKEMWGQDRSFYITPPHFSDIDGPVIEKVLPRYGLPEPTFLLGIKRKMNLVTWFLAQSVNYKLVWAQTVIPRNDSERLDRRRMNRELLEWTRSPAAKLVPIVFFLEGTRSRTKLLGKGVPGSTVLIPRSSLIVPVGIWPTDTIMPVGSRKYRKRVVFVKFGEPIEIAELYDRYRNFDRLEQRVQIVDHVMGKIAELLPHRYLKSDGIK